MSRDPATLEQWQEAVDAANGALALEAARQYGFVSGGPGVDVARCEEILERGARLNVHPSEESIERFVIEAQTAAIAVRQ